MLQSMKKLEESLLEKTSALKRVELQLHTTTIQLETKLAHMNALLEENREVYITVMTILLGHVTLHNIGPKAV